MKHICLGSSIVLIAGVVLALHVNLVQSTFGKPLFCSTAMTGWNPGLPFSYKAHTYALVDNNNSSDIAAAVFLAQFGPKGNIIDNVYLPVNCTGAPKCYVYILNRKLR